MAILISWESHSFCANHPLFLWGWAEKSNRRTWKKDFQKGWGTKNLGTRLEDRTTREPRTWRRTSPLDSLTFPKLFPLPNIGRKLDRKSFREILVKDKTYSTFSEGNTKGNGMGSRWWITWLFDDKSGGTIWPHARTLVWFLPWKVLRFQVLPNTNKKSDD